MSSFIIKLDGLAMSVRESQITVASVWRSDYERCREIYGVTSDSTKRLRAQLVKAARDTSLARVTRDTLLGVVTQIDDERRGR